MDIGVLTLPGYRFAAHTARMYRCNTDEDERPGWGFFIATSEPFEEPPRGEDDCSIFPLGAALYAEDEPVPLPEIADFTGLDFFLKESCQPDGEVYFTFNPMEAHDVSDVRIQFLERQGSRYRVELSALVYDVFSAENPAELRFSGWLQDTTGQDADAEPGVTPDSEPTRKS